MKGVRMENISGILKVELRHLGADIVGIGDIQCCRRKQEKICVLE